MIDQENLQDIVERESWGSLSFMMLHFKLELNPLDPKSKKTKKELEMVRHLVSEHLKKLENGDEFPTAAFYVQISKTIQRAEKAIENNGVRNKDFILFLKFILHKLKKEKLIVFKFKERQEEWNKLKGLLEEEAPLNGVSKA